jgi:hypothetical protein
MMNTVTKKVWQWCSTNQLHGEKERAAIVINAE